ncbi:MAG: amino acid ABC transporter permease [Motilibacteraceae bacterium]
MSATGRASVLHDAPGPLTIRRHRTIGAASTAVVALLAAGLLVVLGQRGQLAADRWDFLQDPDTWKALGKGLLATIQVAVVAVAVALLVGAVLAALRLSERWWLRRPAAAFVEFFRAVPLVLLILFLFLGFGNDLGRFWSLVIGLVLYNGSVLAEIFRAGVLAVPRGQSEAALAIGLTRGQVLRLVLMPQAVRLMLPALVSQSVVALKDSALGLVIGYQELARTSQLLFVYYNNPLQVGLVAAAIYVAVNYTLSKIAYVLDARSGARRSGGSAAPQLVSLAEEGALSEAGEVTGLPAGERG